MSLGAVHDEVLIYIPVDIGVVDVDLWLRGEALKASREMPLEESLLGLGCFLLLQSIVHHLVLMALDDIHMVGVEVLLRTLVKDANLELLLPACQLVHVLLIVNLALALTVPDVRGVAVVIVHVCDSLFGRVSLREIIVL